MFFRKKSAFATPPTGMGRANIRTESSICTGETTIGFYDPHTGKLLQAVEVRSPQDIADYYGAYGYEPPRCDGRAMAPQRGTFIRYIRNLAVVRL